MKYPLTLSLCENQYKQLKTHLFPNDGFEAAAILLCGRCGTQDRRLTVEKIIDVPYVACKNRTKNSLAWPGDYIEEAIEESIKTDNSIILIHSHPGSFPDFSDIDNASDHLTIPSLQHGSNIIDIPHGSAIMLSNGLIKARLYDPKMKPTELTKILVVGENIKDISVSSPKKITPFTSQMTRQLASYTVCVVGLSGTGSIIAEMLARLGVGHLILIDFDRVEHRNLNRILYATILDAQNREFKTTVSKRAILSHHPSTKVTTIERSIEEREAIIAASDADFIFSSVDSIKGRYFCDLIAQAFLTPLIDMGVTIPTRKRQDQSIAIADALGRVDYVFPNGPTLFDRGIISAEGLRSEYLYHADRANYQTQVNEGYIKGYIEEAPSVISLNMRAASAAVNEWLSRLYKIRQNCNSLYAQTIFSLSDCDEEHTPTQEFNTNQNNLLGRGLRTPLLNLPQFYQINEAA